MTRVELLQIAKPILFNTEMVRAILEDRKTVTRRLVKFLNGKNPNWTGYIKDGLTLYNGTNEPCNKPAPFKLGDILYVRETWSDHYVPDEEGRAKLEYCYKADGIDIKAECLPGENNRWYPSIHMPKEAARIFLRVKDVRVERLQGMTEEDALKEGIHYDECPAGFTWKQHTSMTDCHTSAVGAFEYLWNSTIKKSDLALYGWDANPWVWRIEFERIEPESEE